MPDGNCAAISGTAVGDAAAASKGVAIRRPITRYRSMTVGPAYRDLDQLPDSGVKVFHAQATEFKQVLHAMSSQGLPRGSVHAIGYTGIFSVRH